MAKAFFCPYCGKRFTSEDRYHKHAAEEHPPKDEDWEHAP